MVTKTVQISEPLSLEMWNLITYLRGRKKGLIAVIATGVALLIQDSELGALLAGVVFEGLFSVIDFYFSKVNVVKVE